MEKNWVHFGDLDPIFKVTQGLRLLKNGLSAPYLMKEWMDFEQLYFCDMKKNWLDFGDLDSIFKVTGGLILLENGFSAPYLQNEWMDFDQTCTPALVAQLDAPSDWRPGGRGFNPRRGRQHSFMEIDHEIFSTVILSLPLIQEGQLSVSGKRMCTILVNRLED